MAALAGNAAYLGATTYLRRKPEDKPRFVAALINLNALIESGNNDPIAFVDALQSLPIKRLQGDDAALLISTVIVLWDTYLGSTVDLDNKVYVGPVLRATRDGLKRALEIATP